MRQRQEELGNEQRQKPQVLLDEVKELDEPIGSERIRISKHKPNPKIV